MISFDRKYYNENRIALVAIGLGFLLLAAITVNNALWLSKYFILKENAIKTKAIITEKYVKEGIGTTNYGVFADYKIINGDIKKGSYLIPDNSYLTYKIGDSIEIQYNKDMPEKSTLCTKNVELHMKIFSTILSAPLSLLLFLLLIANPKGRRTRAVFNFLTQWISSLNKK